MKTPRNAKEALATAIAAIELYSQQHSQFAQMTLRVDPPPEKADRGATSAFCAIGAICDYVDPTLWNKHSDSAGRVHFYLWGGINDPVCLGLRLNLPIEVAEALVILVDREAYSPNDVIAYLRMQEATS